jgi:stress-induced morphogen
MADSTSQEVRKPSRFISGIDERQTHFRVYITSDAFAGKSQPARHRMIYALLKDELAKAGGIHALQLRTRTSQEEARLSAESDGDATARAAES